MFLRYSLFRLQKNFKKRGYHENIIVRRYGKRYFKNHSIYDDFLDIFGLAPTDEYTISTFERNARLSGNTNEIQRILNSVPSASQKDYTFFYHMLSEVTSEDPELRQRIIHLEQASQTQSKTISDLKEKLKHPAKTILSKVLK